MDSKSEFEEGRCQFVLEEQVKPFRPPLKSCAGISAWVRLFNGYPRHYCAQHRPMIEAYCTGSIWTAMRDYAH